MNRIVCICNTYYQLIFSIQLKKTLYSKDYVVLLLSDHSRNYMSIAENLRECSCFDEVYVVETKLFDSIFANPKKAKKEARKLFEEFDNQKFDELLYFNKTKSTTLLWAILFERNSGMRAIKFEEGILSYNSEDYKIIPVFSFWYLDRLVYYIRKCIPNINIVDKTETFYCFYPSLYKGKLSAHSIPLIDRENVGAIIVKTFGVNKDDLIYKYKEKYMFFTSVYDFEGGEAIGELELVRSIADVVGKENLLIKMHPRDTRTVYADEGFHIDTNSSVPFEALLFAYDFSDKILLTATSGAVLSASLMLGNPPETYYMYPLCKFDKNPTAQKTIEQIDQVLCHESMRDQLQKIHVCSCVRDIVH